MDEVTKREKWVFFGILAAVLACVLMFTFCTPTHAGDDNLADFTVYDDDQQHDADFYKRTGTKPPMPKGESFLLFNALYSNQPGVLAGYGYQFKQSGVMLQAQIGYVYSETVNGTVPYTVGCRTYQVPFAVPADGNRVVSFGVAVPLRGKK